MIIIVLSFYLIFTSFLPVLIALVCKSDKKIILSSILITTVTLIMWEPIMLSDIGVNIPSMSIKFLGQYADQWLFVINLFMVLLHNRKKLF